MAKPTPNMFFNLSDTKGDSSQKNAWVLCFILTCSFLLSGCIEPLVESGSSEDSDGLSPEPGYSTLSGIVVTESLNPVVDANISIYDKSGLIFEKKTDNDGKFVIRNLDPGELNIQATSDCCKKSIERLAVEQGEIREFIIFLDVLTQDERKIPYVEELDWTGFLSCTLRWVDVPPVPSGINPCHIVDGVGEITGIGNVTDDDFMRHWTVRPGLKSVVGGMVWKSPGAALGGELELFMEPGNGSEVRYTKATGTSPLEWRVDEGDIIANFPEEFHYYDFSNFTEQEELRYRVFAAGDLNVVYQQKFNVYWNLHYWESAPSTATALPEG